MCVCVCVCVCMCTHDVSCVFSSHLYGTLRRAKDNAAVKTHDVDNVGVPAFSEQGDA